MSIVLLCTSTTSTIQQAASAAPRVAHAVHQPRKPRVTFSSSSSAACRKFRSHISQFFCGLWSRILLLCTFMHLRIQQESVWLRHGKLPAVRRRQTVVADLENPSHQIAAVSLLILRQDACQLLVFLMITKNSTRTPPDSIDSVWFKIFLSHGCRHTCQLHLGPLNRFKVKIGTISGLFLCHNPLGLELCKRQTISILPLAPFSADCSVYVSLEN